MSGRLGAYLFVIVIQCGVHKGMASFCMREETLWVSARRWWKRIMVLLCMGRNYGKADPFGLLVMIVLQM